MAPKTLKFGFWLVRTVPEPLLRPLPYIIGGVAYLLSGKGRRTIIANQRQVLGTASPLRLHWQALRVIVNLFHSYHMLARLPTMSDEQIRRAVVCEGDEQLTAALAGGRGAVISARTSRVFRISSRPLPRFAASPPGPSLSRSNRPSYS